MIEELYYYNGEPLPLSYSNDLTWGDKIQIVEQIQNDFNSGMLSAEQMRWIVLNGRYGGYTVQRIIDRMLFEGKYKVNPITNDKRTFKTIKKPFDL